MMKHSELLDVLKSGIEHFNRTMLTHGSVEPQGAFNDGRFLELWSEYLTRLASNYPFAHPAYAGQMLKPPHPVAWIAYSMAMLINSNNHALDGGPDTSMMEKEVIAQIIQFFEFPDESLGHLTTSGTFANLEALWIARCIHPDKAIAFTHQAHYTHERMCEVLGLKSIKLEESLLEPYLMQNAEQIGTLVVSMGTTGTGSVEPLHRWLPLCQSLGIRIHIDAAYGGFFKGLSGSGIIEDAPWKFTGWADSLVVDPHKHGLQPYGCGCVLFRDPSIGPFYKHDSPYTYFTSEELHLGEISLECSKSGSAAAALWFTLSMYPLNAPEGLAETLYACRAAAKSFEEVLLQTGHWDVLNAPELDIVCYFPKQGIHSLSQLQEICKRIMDSAMQGEPSQRVYVSLFAIPISGLSDRFPEWVCDLERVTVLRSVFMKPEHHLYVPELVRRLEYHRVEVMKMNF